MKFQKVLKSTAAIVAPPSVRILPTLLRTVATAAQTPPKASTTPS